MSGLPLRPTVQTKQDETPPSRPERGRLSLTLRHGDRIRLTTPSGEVFWVRLYGQCGRATLQFDAEKHTRIVRESLLPADEHWAVTQGRE